MVVEIARADLVLKWLFLTFPTHKPMLRSRLNKVFWVKNFSIIPLILFYYFIFLIFASEGVWSVLAGILRKKFLRKKVQLHFMECPITCIASLTLQNYFHVWPNLFCCNLSIYTNYSNLILMHFYRQY